MLDTSLSTKDVEVLCAAIDLFIPNKVPGAKSSRKHELNSFAKSAKNKLLNEDSKFSGNELNSIYLSLVFSQTIRSKMNANVITTPDFKRNKDEYSYLLDDLVEKFEYIFSINDLLNENKSL